jgi:CheY-like chemotaxis protein
MSASVLVAVTDLFFLTRIRRTAEQIGLSVVRVHDLTELLTCARSQRPSVIILDLMDRRLDALAALGALKADEQLKTIPTIGFFAHVRTDVKEKAERAGCDRVVPRSVFTAHLAELLGTYG